MMSPRNITLYSPKETRSQSQEQSAFFLSLQSQAFWQKRTSHHIVMPSKKALLIRVTHFRTLTHMHTDSPVPIGLIHSTSSPAPTFPETPFQTGGVDQSTKIHRTWNSRCGRIRGKIQHRCTTGTFSSMFHFLCINMSNNRKFPFLFHYAILHNAVITKTDLFQGNMQSASSNINDGTSPDSFPSVLSLKMKLSNLPRVLITRTWMPRARDFRSGVIHLNGNHKVGETYLCCIDKSLDKISALPT